MSTPSTERGPLSDERDAPRAARRSPRPSRLRRQQPRIDWRRLITGNLVSLLLHAVLLAPCAFIVFDREQIEEIFTSLGMVADPLDVPLIQVAPNVLDDAVINNAEGPNVAELLEPTPDLVNWNQESLELSAPLEAWAGPGLDLQVGDDFSGRTAAAKAALVRKFGGNSASEAAVASGLKWLADRQLKDGGWSFDHTSCEACRPGGCTQPGALKDCRNGATALALLAFLGGGHTHQHGDYRRVVKAGLDALLEQGIPTKNGLDLRQADAGGSMYVQGLAAIALCETAALTKDSRFAKAAAGAVKFIVYAQDPQGGGWRYHPRQKGDTSVVGWQVMALKSAQNAKVKFPPAALKKSEKFLDFVQAERGAVYGYDHAPQAFGDASPTTTAVGLLCRMYLGWDQQTPALQQGVKYLGDVKPSPGNMYYNYYATQVLHHWGGEEWTRWNETMRDHLVRTQLKEGIEAGSWDVTDPHGGAGGRLYQTCLCVMTLEVYYRHLPIYQREKLKVEF